MKTKVNVFAAVLIILMSTGALRLMAQAGGPDDPKEDKKARIEALKVAFITQQLNLTTAEAEKFWPVYNEFNTKRDELAKSKRQLMKDARKTGLDNITDKQAEEIVQAEFKFEQQVLDLKKEYFEKYKLLLGTKKAAKLFQAEREFNDFLLQQLKGKDDRPHPPRR